MTRSVFMLGGGTAAVGAAAVAGFVVWQQARTAEPASLLAETPAAVVAPAPQDTPEQEATQPAVAAPASEPAPEPIPQADAIPAPAFAAVRIDAAGNGLVSGSGFGDGPVVILLGQDVLAEVDVDANGKFATFVTVPPSDQARRLTLRQGDLVSEGSVLVAPFAAAQDAPADPPVEPVAPAETPSVAEPAPAEEGTEVAAQPVEPAPESVVEPTPEPKPEPEAEPTPEPTPEPQAPALLVTGAQGPQILSAGPSVLDRLALDTITYSSAGDFVLGGRATGAAVRIYLDNRPVMDIPVTAQGVWSAEMPEVDEGVYTLRVDALDDQDKVIRRIETPVRRQDPAQVAQVMAEDTAKSDFDVAVRTVQPGNSLWAIAEEAYGDGIMYVQVFEANADLIRNPDLIYPGQVFRLPRSD